MRHELFPADELAPGTMRAAALGSVAIVVIRDGDGRLSALRDICPHHLARLSRGKLQQKVVGETVGAKDLSSDYIVRCPRHGYEFDVATGLCPADARQRVRAYPVTTENGMIVVER
jgi:3-phenylpropionate/trans-cinnamate dioxygenase ferredoxin subunit